MESFGLLLGLSTYRFSNSAAEGIATEVNQNLPRMMVTMFSKMMEVTVVKRSCAVDEQLTAIAQENQCTRVPT